LACRSDGRDQSFSRRFTPAPTGTTAVIPLDLSGHLGTPWAATGAIVDPIRVDWEPGAAFVTPPGLWHSHHNESGRPARILPIQDAGLHTYLRSLDIRFTR
jgi:hypothetical protein